MIFEPKGDTVRTIYLDKGCSLGPTTTWPPEPRIESVEVGREDLEECEALLKLRPLMVSPSKFVRGPKNEIVLVWTYADRYALLETGGAGEFAMVMATRGDTKAEVWRFGFKQLERALESIQKHLRPQKSVEPASGAPALSTDWLQKIHDQMFRWPESTPKMPAFYNPVLGEPFTAPADMMA